MPREGNANKSERAAPGKEAIRGQKETRLRRGRGEKSK